MQVPEDIECLVFEVAARDDRATALQLALVARRVQYWTRPLLYESVTLSDIRALHHFLRTLGYEDGKITPFAAYVKRLRLLSTSHEIYQIVWLLSACSYIISLDYWPSPWPTRRFAPDDISVLKRLHLQHLSCPLELIANKFSSQSDVSFLSCITHLEIKDYWKTWAYWHLSFPESLRYLSVDVISTDSHYTDRITAFIERVLESCPKLAICVVLCTVDHEYICGSSCGTWSGADMLGVDDPRVVIMPAEELEENCCLYTPDLWARAEEMVCGETRGGMKVASDA